MDSYGLAFITRLFGVNGFFELEVQTFEEPAFKYRFWSNVIDLIQTLGLVGLDTKLSVTWTVGIRIPILGETIWIIYANGPPSIP